MTLSEVFLPLSLLLLSYILLFQGISLQSKKRRSVKE
jgi:hypothetical protein